MKRVKLDEEFERFKEKFCETHNLEGEWQTYQQQEGLVDVSNNSNLKRFIVDYDKTFSLQLLVYAIDDEDAKIQAEQVIESQGKELIDDAQEGYWEFHGAEEDNEPEL